MRPQHSEVFRDSADLSSEYQALSLEVKKPKREAYPSPPVTAEVKNAWNYNSTLHIFS
jgi:hypothetical protein